MFRFLFALTLIFAALPAACAQTQAAPPHSMIFAASDPSALAQFEEDITATQRMTDRLVLAATGQRDVGKAWRTLVTPKDRVGIKVSTAGGRYFSSHRGVVAAIVAGLEQAGVPRSQVVVWDRDSARLREAGFVEKRGGYAVRAVDPPRGLDPEAKVIAPMVGKLIWGDLLFRGRPSKPAVARASLEDEQLSQESHLAAVLSREVTKIVNVAVLADEPGCGVAGALYNVTVPNVDNGRRFTRGPGAAAISDLYSDARIGPRIVLHFLDGLVAQYAGGPGFDPNYAFIHGTLYASKDPVALDAMALRKIEAWRVEAKLPPIGKHAAWLEEAESLGLGNFAAERITIQRVGAAP